MENVTRVEKTKIYTYVTLMQELKRMEKERRALSVDATPDAIENALQQCKNELHTIDEAIETHKNALQELKAARERIAQKAKGIVSLSPIGEQAAAKNIVAIDRGLLRVVRTEYSIDATLRIVNNGYWYAELKKIIADAAREYVQFTDGAQRAILVKAAGIVIDFYGVKFPQEMPAYNG